MAAHMFANMMQMFMQSTASSSAQERPNFKPTPKRKTRTVCVPNSKAVLTYEHLTQVYSRMLQIDFSKPVDINFILSRGELDYIAPSLQVPKNEFSFTMLINSIIVHTFDLFLYASNPSFSTQNPQFTFPYYMADYDDDVEQFPGALALFPNDLSPNPTNIFLPPLAPPKSSKSSKSSNQSQPTSHFESIASFTDIKDEDYIIDFVDGLGNVERLSNLLRSTTLLFAAIRNLRISFEFVYKRARPSDSSQWTPTIISVLRRCFIHLHIICDHYNIVECGGLNFAGYLHHLSLHPNYKPSEFYTSEVDLFPTDISHYNEDEIIFLTKILPNAYQASPMYPGLDETDELGCIIPTHLEPAQHASFTQHYTELLDPNAVFPDTLNNTKSPIELIKVPTSKIPFSIFYYLGLLNYIMIDGLRLLHVLIESDKGRQAALEHGLEEFLPILYTIPTLPYNCLLSVIGITHSCFAPSMDLNSLTMSKLIPTILVFFNFKLRQFVTFPIQIQDPTSSIRIHPPLLFRFLHLLLKILHKVASLAVTFPLNHHIPYNIYTLSLFVLNTTFILLWADQFPSLSLLALQASPDSTITSETLRGTLSLTQKRFLSGYLPHIGSKIPFEACPASPASFSIHYAQFLSPYISTFFNKNPKVVEFQDHSQLLTDALYILHHLFKNAQAPDNVLASTFASFITPEYNSMLFSLVLRYKVDPTVLIAIQQLRMEQNVFGDSSTTIFSNMIQHFELVATVPHKFPLSIPVKRALPFLPSLTHDSAEKLTMIKMLCQMFTSFKEKSKPDDIIHLLTGSTFLPCMNHILATQYHSSILHLYPLSHESINHQKLGRECLETFNLSTETQKQRGAIETLIESGGTRHIYPHMMSSLPNTFPAALGYFPEIFNQLSIFFHNKRLYHALQKPYARLSKEIDEIISAQFGLFMSIMNNLSTQIHYEKLYYLNSAEEMMDYIDGETCGPQRENYLVTFDRIGIYTTSSVMLVVNPMIYTIPYIAIQHNFNRTLFQLISTFDFSTATRSLNSLNASNFSWILQYLEMLHTFICKPVTFCRIGSYNAVSSDCDDDVTYSSFGDDDTYHPTSIGLSSALLKFGHDLEDESLHLELELVKTGQPLDMTTPLLTDELESMLFLPQDQIYCKGTSQVGGVLNLCNVSKSEAFQDNSYQHVHLPQAVVKQLYYIYTEALICVIQGFVFTLYQNPYLNDPLILNSSLDTGITKSFGPLRHMSSTGTFREATRPFSQENTHLLKRKATLASDSYHTRLCHLDGNRDDLLSVFTTPNIQQKKKNLQKQQERKPKSKQTIPLAYEWSSVMVQHCIELFIELLLNKRSFDVISQINFSNDTQPLAKEYVINSIPNDPNFWIDKKCWTTNIPSDCTDADSFPLYSTYIPTKTQAQIPTLAGTGISPQNQKDIAHSIFTPQNISGDERTAMIQYYQKDHPTRVPPNVWNHAKYTKNEIIHAGFKTATRGHLPFFYNLTQAEQNTLYEIFSYENLFHHEPSSRQNHSNIHNSGSNVGFPTSPLFLEHPKHQIFHEYTDVIPTLPTTVNKEQNQNFKIARYEINLSKHIQLFNDTLPALFKTSMVQFFQSASSTNFKQYKQWNNSCLSPDIFRSLVLSDQGTFFAFLYGGYSSDSNESQWLSDVTQKITKLDQSLTQDEYDHNLQLSFLSLLCKPITPPHLITITLRSKSIQNEYTTPHSLQLHPINKSFDLQHVSTLPMTYTIPSHLFINNLKEQALAERIPFENSTYCSGFKEFLQLAQLFHPLSHNLFHHSSASCILIKQLSYHMKYVIARTLQRLRTHITLLARNQLHALDINSLQSPMDDSSTTSVHSSTASVQPTAQELCDIMSSLHEFLLASHFERKFTPK